MPDPRRHDRDPSPGGRGDDRRQGGLRGPLLFRRQPHVGHRSGAQPVDPTRSAGGSSSGSAALVAAGEVDMATGGDQGGSVRIPSAYCGTVGHKPTHGLVPYTGAFPIELTLDHLGPITRTVADAALMLGVMAGADGLDPRQPPGVAPRGLHRRARRAARRLRVGVVSEGFGLPDLSSPPSTRPCGRRPRRCAAQGCVVDDVSIPWHPDAMHVWNVIATEGATAQMIDANAYGMNWKGSTTRADRVLRPAVAGAAPPGSPRPSSSSCSPAGTPSSTSYGRHYAMARNLAYELPAAYDEALASHDVLVMPTLPITATTLPATGRAARGVPRPGTGDDRQHGAVRRHRPSGDVRAGGPRRRAAGGPDDHRPALRRRHLLYGWPPRSRRPSAVPPARPGNLADRYVRSDRVRRQAEGGRGRAGPGRSPRRRGRATR